MKTNHLIALVLLAALLFSGCAKQLRVGELRSESQSVKLGDTSPMKVEISFGAGDLEVSGGASELLEADFYYNVAELKPDVRQSGSTLVVRQPSPQGLPDLRTISSYRNEWDLRLNQAVPLDLRIDIGAGASYLKLAGLSLSRFNLDLGAGTSTIDLSGGWAHDLNVRIECGAADITIRLPSDVGARVEIEAGPHPVQARGLVKNGEVYTNEAYGVSDVTLRIHVQAGIGSINLEAADEAAATP
jgi:hypothetical protein